MKKNLRKALVTHCLMAIISIFSLTTTTYAQKNIAPLGTTNCQGSGGVTPYCWNWQNISNGTWSSCGTQDAFVWTTAPPGGSEWMEWVWTSSYLIQEVKIYHANTTGRFLAGGTIQKWDGSAWVDHYTFSGLTMQCENTIKFTPFAGDRLRIAKWYPATTGQNSNMNYREIEIWTAASPFNAGVNAMVSPTSTCTNNQSITATFSNLGLIKIDSADIQWSINGTMQTPYPYNKYPNYKHSDTLPSGKGVNIVLAASYALTDYTNYNFKIWSSMPNGKQDTVNGDDTLRYTLNFLGSPKTPATTDVRRCGVGEVPLSCTPGDSKDFIIWWDKPTGGKMIGTGKDILSPFIYKTDSFYVEAARIASTVVLANGMNGGTIISGDMTSYNGGYFDLTTSTSTLQLDSLTFRLWQAYANSSYQLYYRVGSFAGYEKDATAWTLISQGVGKYTATGNLITVDNIGLILSPNTKYAFYFTTDPSTQGNDVYLNSGAITTSNGDISFTGGACNWGLFGSNGVYTTWTIDVRIGYKKSCPSPGRGKVVVTIIPSPTGATLLKGSAFNGVYNAGTLKNPDMVAETRTINYELRPPTKFTNSTYGTDWFISGLSMGTINGTPIPTGDTTMSQPSAAGNGMLSYTPSPGWEDSTIRIVVNIYDVSVACDSIIQRHIFVAPTPRPNFNGQDVCLGTAMEFVNKSTISSGFMTYFWDFDDGTTSDFEAPIHLFTRSGLFRVRLTATSDLGIVNDTVIDINVFEIPDIRFTVSNQCEGVAIKFNNTTTISSGILSYKWDFGDGSTDNATSPSHLYAKAGGYKVTLVAEANNCQSTLTKNASQFARPKASFTNSGDCSGKEVSFNNTSTIALGEKVGTQWFYGDGNQGTQANQKHTYANAGTMSVKLIAVSQFGCKDSLTKSLVIKPSPVADFTYDKICDVDPVNFSNTSAEPAGVAVIYNWEFGDGAVSTQKNPTHKYNTLGPKRITLMATAANGCFTQIDKDVEVLVQPVANFEVSNGCAGEQISFVNKSTVSKGDMLYTWTFGDGNSSNVASPKKTYTPTISTTYVVVLETNVLNGCSDKITKSVDIKEQPTCGFTAKVSPTDRRTWTFTPNNNSYGPNAYTWVFEGSGVSTDVSPTHTFDYYDFQYRIIMRVKTPDGCECLDSTYNLRTAWGLGVNDQKLNDGIKLYPNPSTGVVTLELSDWTLSEQAIVTVFDATGREVKTIDMVAGKQVIDLDDMSNGMYTLRVDRRNSKRPSRTTRVILRR